MRRMVWYVSLLSQVPAMQPDLPFSVVWDLRVPEARGWHFNGNCFKYFDEDDRHGAAAVFACLAACADAMRYARMPTLLFAPAIAFLQKLSATKELRLITGRSRAAMHAAQIAVEYSEILRFVHVVKLV